MKAFWAGVGVGSVTRGRRRDPGQAGAHGPVSSNCASGNSAISRMTTVSFVKLAALGGAPSTALAMLRDWARPRVHHSFLL